MDLLALGVDAVERGILPDSFTRAAIRRLCRKRLAECRSDSQRPPEVGRSAFLESLRNGPIAPQSHKANEQHYELPPEFFTTVLGPHRKYSCCYWPGQSTRLEEAEATALAMTCEHAAIEDGQSILELGCGWGSLSLWMAERYPNCRITAVSNAASQRRFIESQAALRRLTNLHVVTADINDFDPSPDTPGSGRFDRVVSVEMFEHLRNYELLLNRIATWLHGDGKLFVHIFVHREFHYPFQSEGSDDWMGRYFFTGGMMPSANLIQKFDKSLRVVRRWNWNGLHYSRTADEWLARLDANHDEILPILVRNYGEREAQRWMQRWRVFFLSVSELFGYAEGEEWSVMHYLLEPVHH